MKKLLLLLIFIGCVYGDDYDFDMGAIEQKPYEYSGYLRLDDKLQHLQNDKYQNFVHAEALLDFSYNYDIFKLSSSFIGTHNYIKDVISESDAIVNDLYIEAKLNTNHTLLAGKESLMWGKGYFFNPLAFFDRLKDPSDPTKAREGFIIAKYSYNKSFNSELKNLSFDFVYLPSTSEVNSDYYKLITQNENANNIALRLYMLLYDTDIDIIYNYSDIASNKIGIDFSKNIQTNFEVHGEYANVLDGGYSYLLGLRYLTEFELTIISEYLYRSEGLNKEEIETTTLNIPFIAKDYAITLITQKEPFDFLYFSLYYKNMLNLQDHSMQNKIGAAYLFKNNTDLDISYNVNSGDALSEFGKKSVEDFLWLRLTWKF
ncbi:MAG: hypothetical protein U9Q40_07690 [Campylobacterota bacterium]|nr:hypothetical protein [Campylobacterota bacterium]